MFTVEHMTIITIVIYIMFDDKLAVMVICVLSNINPRSFIHTSILLYLLAAMSVG